MSEKILIDTFTKKRSWLLRLAQKFLPDADDVDDALQEAFCRLWHKADELESPRDAEAMAYTTVRNLCVDSVREKNKAQMVGLTENLDFEEEDETVRKQELEEQYRAVDQIVEECLTDLQRSVFIMKEYEGLGYSDIAERLGIQETAVRMNLSRARKQIRMCYLKQQNR